MVHQSSSPARRGGFTLIELLVVISIIIILVGLTSSAVMRFRQTGPRLATQSNLRNLKAKVNTQWQAVRDKAQTETISPTSLTVLSGLGFTNLSDPRARAAYVQLKLAQAFPQSFDEVMNDTAANGRLPAWQGYKTYLSSLGVTPANAATIAPTGPTTATSNNNVQAAVCLMMAVERGPSNLNITQESLGSTGTRSYPIGTGNAFGVADAFGGPLAFSRGAAGPVIKCINPNFDPNDPANQ